MSGTDGASTPAEPAEGSAKRFDPSKYLVNLNGRGEYLEVKWRLLWLRTEHPEASIETEMVKLEERSAVFKATIVIPEGGAATGWGSETAGDFRDFLEKAETKALGRALAALGYGSQFCQDHEHGDTGWSEPGSAGKNTSERKKTPAEVAAAAKPKESIDEVRARMQAAIADTELDDNKRTMAAEWLFREAKDTERLVTLMNITIAAELKNERVSAAYAKNMTRFNPSYAG